MVDTVAAEHDGDGGADRCVAPGAGAAGAGGRSTRAALAAAGAAEPRRTRAFVVAAVQALHSSGSPATLILPTRDDPSQAGPVPPQQKNQRCR